MNVKELVGDLASSILGSVEDHEQELDGDDIDAISDVVETVLDAATEAIDAAEDEEDDASAKVNGDTPKA